MSNNEVYEKMSDEDRKRMETERLAILEWSVKEEQKAIENIKKEGRYLGGLDGDYPELTAIYQKTKEKIKGLLEKYGFNDSK